MAEGGGLDLRRTQKTKPPRAHLPISDRSRSQPPLRCLEDVPCPSPDHPCRSILWKYKFCIDTTYRRSASEVLLQDMGDGDDADVGSVHMGAHLHYGRGRRRRMGGCLVWGGRVSFLVCL